MMPDLVPLVVFQRNELARLRERQASAARGRARNASSKADLQLEAVDRSPR